MGSPRPVPELAARRVSRDRRAAASRVAALSVVAARAARFAPATTTPSARYPGTCRTRQVPPGDAAIRARVDPGLVAVDDGLQGNTEVDLSASSGDYVIVRRDGLPAYHLAVVVDDAEQGVTTVVRGVDLLESTAAHVHLQARLGVPVLRYYHLPVVVNERQQKLSKQTGAQPIDAGEPEAAANVLELLGLESAGRAQARAAGRFVALGARPLEHRRAARPSGARAALTAGRLAAPGIHRIRRRRRRACSSGHALGDRPRAP